MLPANRIGQTGTKEKVRLMAHMKSKIHNYLVSVLLIKPSTNIRRLPWEGGNELNMKGKNQRKNMIIIAAAISVLMACGGCTNTQLIGLADIGAEG